MKQEIYKETIKYTKCNEHVMKMQQLFKLWFKVDGEGYRCLGKTKCNK